MTFSRLVVVDKIPAQFDAIHGEFRLATSGAGPDAIADVVVDMVADIDVHLSDYELPFLLLSPVLQGTVVPHFRTMDQDSEFKWRSSGSMLGNGEYSDAGQSSRALSAVCIDGRDRSGCDFILRGIFAEESSAILYFRQHPSNCDMAHYCRGLDASCACSDAIRIYCSNDAHHQ